MIKRDNSIKFFSLKKERHIRDGIIIDDLLTLINKRVQNTNFTPKGHELYLEQQVIKSFKKNKQIESFVGKFRELVVVNLESCNIPHYVENYEAISLPKKEFFLDEDCFYSTLFHELTHFTRNKIREGIDKYIRVENGTMLSELEESIAEIGSLILNVNFGTMNSHTLMHHVEYLFFELRNLEQKERKQVLKKAILEANKAVKWLMEYK